MCWAAASGSSDDLDLLKRSADKGCAWTQVLLANSSMAGVDWPAALLEKAVAQGEPTAMYWLVQLLWSSEERTDDNTRRAQSLWRQAAELGDRDSQLQVAQRCCESGSPEQLAWLRRSALLNYPFALQLATVFLPGNVWKYEEGGSGRSLYEIAIALDSLPEWRMDESESTIAAGEQALKLLRQWHSEAKRAVVCWMWLARKEGIPKDMRLLVADLIWDERVAWCERIVHSNDV